MGLVMTDEATSDSPAPDVFEDLPPVEAAPPAVAPLDEFAIVEEPPSGSEPEPVPALGTQAVVDDRRPWYEPRWVSLLAALAAAVYVFLQLRPGLLLSSTTPAGGDMGAHVWGPAYLRDHLLPQWRLSGWTPDWYGGFPAYHFYMVVPALAIIAVNAGFAPVVGLPLAAGSLGLAWFGARRFTRWRGLLWSIGGIVAVSLVGVSYGASFKLVSVAGLVAFPVAAWAMATFAGAREPVPGLVAIGATVFLFDTNFEIYGGNIASTLAGEFSFSLSLALGLLAIGLAIRSMDSGRYLVTTAVLLALVALCHIIPLFFVIVALVAAVALHPSVGRGWIAAVGISIALLPTGFAEGASRATLLAGVVSFTLICVALWIGDPAVRSRFTWLLTVGPPAALLTGFWLVPFYLRAPYFNDMGWGRRNDIADALLTTPMRWALPLAAVGAVLAFAGRDRIGILFTILGATSATAVANLPEGKLWNARLLPFYYLSVYVVAAVAVGLVVRYAAVAVTERFDRPHRVTLAVGAAVATAVTLIGISLPLRTLPGAGRTDSGAYTWLGLRSNQPSVIPGWSRWNYSGYEEKASYREYHGIVSTMDEVGAEFGCGRAMWEYSSELDRYGTPMALMLLPFWTDGCIGSMEGLYFESSASTPFHFLNQSRLSTAPSRAQRDLPYGGFDLDRGLAQLRTTGVRYYLVHSDEALAETSDHEGLVEIARSEPWVVYEVAGSALVTGLDHLPVVASGPANEGESLPTSENGELEMSPPEPTRFEQGWLSQAIEFYDNPDGFDGWPAEDGPDDWERVTTLRFDDGEPIVPATVSDIDVGRDEIRFSVDEVGKPVVVRTSYFPNWKVSGADGPWRVGPNLMVVVPTSTEVRLHYGYTAVDYLGYGLTLLGVVILFLIHRNTGQARGDTVPEPRQA